MKITTTKAVPDNTYFRVGDVEPCIENDALVILNGRGTRRSWGAPQVNSTVIFNDDAITSVLVGFSHKHGGSQFVRHVS